MSTYTRSGYILTRVASSGGCVAETLDHKTAAGGASPQSALAHLTRKLMQAEGIFPEGDSCVECYGDGDFEVGIIDHGDGFSRVTWNRPILIECSRCEGSGIEPDLLEGLETAREAEREARQWMEEAA